MEKIQTLKGLKDLSQYHRICPHEHLILDMTHEAVAPKTQEETELFYGEVTMERLGILRRNPYIVRDNLILDSAEDAAKEIKFLGKHKVDLFLDLTPSVGLGRDIKKLQYISENTDIDIVCGTGFFVHDALDEKTASLNRDQMAEIMLREINEGIEGTNLRAGVIGEVGVSEKIYPIERESLLATAMVYEKTGLPIYLHTYPWSRAGLEAAELLIEKGVDSKSICVCHIDVTFDYEYLIDLLDLGVYIEFDNFSKEFYFPPQDGAFAGGPFATDVERVRMLKKLIADGYGKQVLVAVDLCLKASLRKYGGWGYDHIFENIIPMMQQEGFSPEEITQIVDRNPLNFLKQ